MEGFFRKLQRWLGRVDRQSFRHIHISSPWSSSRNCANYLDQKPKKDDELLISRLLFLTSYGTTQSFSQLIEVHHLSDYINDNIARHSRKWAKSEVKGQAGYGYQTLSETLKLLFNITHFCPQKKAAFSQSIVPILKILTCHEFSSLPRPVHPPINHLINALLNLNLEEKKGLHGRSFQKVDLRASIEKLTRILDITLKAYAVPEFNTTVVPLLTLLKCLATISPPNIRCLMKSSLLPTRQQLGPLPVDDSLPSRLLRLMAKPVTPLTYDALTNLFFELSDRDPEQAINRLGVGMMGGFVLSRNLQLPAIPSDTASIHSAKSCSSIRSQATSDVSRPPSPDAPEEQNSTLSCEVPLDEHP